MNYHLATQKFIRSSRFYVSWEFSHCLYGPKGLNSNHNQPPQVSKMTDQPVPIEDPKQDAKPNPDTGLGLIDVSNIRSEDSNGIKIFAAKKEAPRKYAEQREAQPETFAGAANEGLYSAGFSLMSTLKGGADLIDRGLGSNLKEQLPEMAVPAHAEFGSKRWHGQQVGGAAGIILPFMLTHAGVKRFMSKPMAQSALGQRLAASKYYRPWQAAALEGGTAGAIFEFVGREGDLVDRTKNAAVGFGTFSVLTGSTVKIGEYAKGISNPLVRKMVGNEVSTGIASGAPAGAVHRMGHDLLHGKQKVMIDGQLVEESTLAGMGKDAYTFMFVGGMLGGKDLVKRKLGFEKQTFNEYAVKARENRALNSNLEARLTQSENVRTTEVVGQKANEPVMGELKLSDANSGRGREAKSTMEVKGDKPSLVDQLASLTTGKGREVRRDNRVMAEGEGQIPIDVPKSQRENFNKGLELVDRAIENKSAEELATFLNNDGTHVRTHLLEAAHLQNNKPAIDMLNQLFEINANQSGIMRGEFLVKAASRENAPQEVKDSFTEYANGEGVNMGHWLVEHGRMAQSPEIVKLAVETYSKVESSPLAKELKLQDKVSKMGDRTVETYKAEGVEADLVKTASELVSSRLKEQADPTKNEAAETFDYAKMDQRVNEFERGVEILSKSKQEGVEVDVAELGNFAKGEGAKVGQALLEWAYIVDNPKLVKALEKAYGFDANTSGLTKAEALLKGVTEAATNDGISDAATKNLHDRFTEYAKDKGSELGEYLLGRSVESNNRNMEYVVTTTYGQNLDSPLGQLLNKGGQLADRATTSATEGKVELPKQEMQDLIEFAMTEGQHLGRALEMGAQLAGNERAAIAVKEAYLFAHGRSQRNTGDANLEIPKYLSVQGEAKVPFPIESLKGFLTLVGDGLPTTAAEYVNFRAKVMDYLSKNPELSQRINNETSSHHGKTVAEIVASETAHSVIAGPIDYFYKSNHGLSKFGDIAGVKVKNETTVGGETNVRSTEFETSSKFDAFEASTGLLKQVKAGELAERVGSMTPNQFRKWLDFAHSKSEMGNDISNLNEMTIPESKVLERPEVVEAMKTDTTGEGQLNTIRKLLGDGTNRPVSELPVWANSFISRRLLTASSRLGEGANPNQVLAEALPAWLLNKIADRARVSPEGTITVEGIKNRELDAVLEAAVKADRPGLEKTLTDRTNNRDNRRTEEDSLTTRLKTLDEVLNVKDAEVAERLKELGSEDPQTLRQVMKKLDPETSAPEYAELIKIVLPKAQSIQEVGLLLDTIFVGNKASQAGRPSKFNKNPQDTTSEVAANQQLAMTALNSLVEAGTPQHGRANEIVNGLIDGTYRDPSRFNRGGGDRGKGGDRGRGDNRGRRDNNRGRNDRKEGGD